MDESAPIRAIVIGVSTLLAVATISAVLMYYNSAKQMASNVGRGQDFATNYEQSIQDILTAGTYNVTGSNYITGADVKNLLNYFYNDETVQIDINGINFVQKYEGYIPIASSYNATYKCYSSANLETNYTEAIKSLVDNQKFKIEIKEKETLNNGNVGKKINLNGI